MFRWRSNVLDGFSDNIIAEHMSQYISITYGNFQNTRLQPINSSAKNSFINNKAAATLKSNQYTFDEWKPNKKRTHEASTIYIGPT